MKRTKSIMGMPVVIDVVDKNITDEDINEVFSFFHHIDKKFSTYKNDSEISLINSGEIKSQSEEMKKILTLCEDYKKITNGFFNININNKLDPSGLVKGYAISQGAKILKKRGFNNFYVEIAGDIQVSGVNHKGKKWSVGIQNPFNLEQIIKVVYLAYKGIATSGNYQRGEHIYNPITKKEALEVASVTVIANDILDADTLATAAFAMGLRGINFLENLKGVEGYIIKHNKTAVFTSGFEQYTID